MIPMSEILNFSKNLLDEYESRQSELGMVQRYFYEDLLQHRHKAVRRYIKSPKYFDDELLEICQRLAVNQVFMHFSALLVIANCKMNQDFTFDRPDYIN